MGRKIALVIGNSEYDDAGLARLITPSEDVNDLATLLKSPDIGGFDEVLALVNESATTLRRSIAKLFVQKSPDDLLLLYFSGHGVLDDQGQLYLAVKDTERELLSGTAIPASFITGEMDRSRSRRQVLVLDCCHSGAFARGSKGAVGASVGTASAFEGTGYGRVVLTATDATQYAWEGDQIIGQADNSVFTHFMIQGLQTGEADQDADGRITLDELYDYVYAQVVARTPRQTPGKWSYRQQGDLVIAKNPHPPVKLLALPSELQQSIEDARPWVREGAVHELDRILRSSDPGLALAARSALERLSEDDSRKVASAAQEVLKTVPSVAPLAGSTGIVRNTSAQAEVAALPFTPQPEPSSDQPPSMPQAERVQANPSSAVPSHQMSHALPIGLPILIATIGWFAGWAIGIELGASASDSQSSVKILIVSAGIAGAVTGWLLRLITRQKAWWPTVLLAVGWPSALILSLNTQGLGSTQNTNLIAAAIGSTWLMSTLALLPIKKPMTWIFAVITGVSTTAVWLLALPYVIDHFSSHGVQTEVAVSLAITTVLGGCVLAIVYWLAHRSEKSIQ